MNEKTDCENLNVSHSHSYVRFRALSDVEGETVDLFVMREVIVAVYENAAADGSVILAMGQRFPITEEPEDAIMKIMAGSATRVQLTKASSGVKPEGLK